MPPTAWSRRQFVHLLGATGVGLSASPRLFAWQDASAQAAEQNKIRDKIRVSDFQKIYDPSVGENERWYINDHTFIQGRDGLWHLFGITHREPSAPQQERFFAHATATNLLGPWTKQRPVLRFDRRQRETVVWAPYVLEHDGRYWMYYCGGGEEHSRFKIQLATSTDLWSWQRCAENPMVVDGVDARDPMVLRVGDQWVMYYTATSAPQGGYHTVCAVTSRDLIHWSDKREVFRSRSLGTYGGDTESPFVVDRAGRYSLFVCTNVGYNQTAVYESDSPFHWELKDEVGRYSAHASEIVHAADGRWYASRAGWGQGGVYLAELVWDR